MPTADTWPEIAKKLGIEGKVAASSSQQTATTATVSGGFSDLMHPCVDGQRTDHLLKLCGYLIGRRVSLEVVLSICQAWNATNRPPLPDKKVVDTCKSIAQRDRANHPDRYGADPSDEAAEPLLPLFDLASASVDDFLAIEPPARKWLLKQFLPQGIVGAVVAPGGSSKSQFLMQLAYSVASGAPLAACWEVAETGTVLMLCAEDERDEIHRRVHRIHDMHYHGQKPAFTKKLLQNLLIRSVVGEDILLTRKGGNGEVERTPTLTRLGLTAAQAENLKLIILDPASRFRGGEENKNEDATRFVEAVEWLKKETGATVLIAHHANKGSMTSHESNQSASRGASAFTDGVRWQINMMTLTKGTKGYGFIPEDVRHLYVEVKLVKTNYTAPHAPTLLRRLDGGYLEVSGEQASEGSPYDKHVGKLIVLVSQGPVTARQIEDHHCGPGKALDVSQKGVRAVIEQAIDMGFIDITPRKPLVLTPLGVEWAQKLAPAKPNTSGRGTARQRRTPRKSAIKSKA